MTIEVKLILYLFLLAAAVLDGRTGKIPNVLVCAALLAGAAWYGQTGWGELGGYGIRIIGFAVPFLVLFFAGMWGGGDVKAIAVIGGLAGWKAGVGILCISLVLAAAAALYKMMRYGILRERMILLSSYIERVCHTGRLLPYPVNRRDRRLTLRMSFFFLAGTFLYRVSCLIL